MRATLMCALAALAIAQPGPLPGLLYPTATSTREVVDLSGIWRFRAEGYSGQGVAEGWYKQPLQLSGPVEWMPVPSSFNDVSVNASIRDFVGAVWYELSGVQVPATWSASSQVINLWVGSVDYYGVVYVNGQQVAAHEGGHLPFGADITALAVPGQPLRITIMCNNTLNEGTIPPASLSYNTAGRLIMTPNFDFFPYAGLHRPIKLHTTPAAVHVDDVTAVTSLVSTTAYLSVAVATTGGATIAAALTDADGNVVATNTTAAAGGAGTVLLSILNAKLWWPFQMTTPGQEGYLYSLSVMATAAGGATDTYTLDVGLRTVTIAGGQQVLVNGVPIYMRGYGKHEDSDLRGKGLDNVLNYHDMRLIQWFNANTFRTSHYPYSEEKMTAADRYGIMVIDESPGVGLGATQLNSSSVLQHHLMVESEHVRRDKNRASAIIWSVANEPSSNAAPAQSYFQQVISHVRSLDSSRPVTFVTCQDYTNDVAVQYVDIMFINKYFGWYVQTGQLDTIPVDLTADINGWLKTFPGKPMSMSEYGADTVAGIHKTPSFVFTEDYQSEFYAAHAAVFDSFRTAPNSRWVGELTWCFADFQTGQNINRVDGNKKGLLTRQRQPKAAALLLRQRYANLAAASPVCPLALGDLVAQGCTSALGLHVTPAIPTGEGYAPFKLHQEQVATSSLRGAVPAPATAEAAAAIYSERLAQFSMSPDADALAEAALTARVRKLYDSGALSVEERDRLLDLLQ